MRVALIYCGEFTNSKGMSASARRIEHFALGFKSANLRADILIPAYNNSDLHSSSNADYSVLNLGVKRRIPILSKMSYWLACLMLITRYDSFLFYDVRFDGGFFGLFVRLLRKTAIYQISDNFSKTSAAHWFNKQIFRFTDWFIPQCANFMVVISESIKTEIRKNVKNKDIIVVPIMVDVEEFDDSHSPNSTIGNHDNNIINIGYTGSFWTMYGVKYLLLAFQKLKEDNKFVRLILAGPENYTLHHDNIPKLTQELGLCNCVEITGWLRTKELKGVVSRCHIMVMPHTDHPFCQYGMPYKLGEYASMGKPIISTNVANVVNYFSHEKSALICKPASSEDMYKALTRLVFDESLRDQIAEGSKKVAWNYFDYKKAIVPLVQRMFQV